MNNDSKKKKIIRFICFVILCALIFTGLNWLFTIKSQINNKVTLENIVADNRTLYKERDHSLDVIAMGSSHAFTSFNPLQMFEEQGFTSLTMAGPFVKIDTAEYLLSEALKTQSPKALVLEVGALQDNGTDYDNFQLEAIINLRPSIEKYNFVQKLYPDDSAMRATAFLPIVGFHVRWVELTPEDFTYLFYRDYMHGFVPVFVKRPGIESQFDISEGKPLVQQEVENLRHLAAYCKEQGVELVLYRSVSTTWTRTNSQAAAALAEELGLEFIDFNAIYDEVGIDPDQDIYDEAHINYFGSVKISAYLGQYLEDRFGFADKRADAAYSRWHEDYNRMMTNMEKYPGYIENK